MPSLFRPPPPSECLGVRTLSFRDNTKAKPPRYKITITFHETGRGCVHKKFGFTDIGLAEKLNMVDNIAVQSLLRA